MRKVFLEDLPRKGGKGVNKGKDVMDCNNWVGREISFIYDEISGVVEVVSFDKGYLTIKYKNNYIAIATYNFVQCRLGSLLGIKTSKFKLEVGQIMNELEIIENGYSYNKNGKKLKSYKYKCSKCSFNGNTPHYDKYGVCKNEYWITEYHLVEGKGCACCSGKIVVPTINAIYVTDKWMVDLGVDAEESKRFASRSNKKVKVKCPHCGREDNKVCADIYGNKSIGCTCGDGFSYPEKFMYSVLKQLGIEFETQLTKSTLKWCDKYRYDFYIPSLNMIIETHGMQHYKESFSSCGGKDMKQEQDNDVIKKKLAISNGIKEEGYIVIDCRESSSEWIKNNILSSRLKDIFDLSKINWQKCEMFAINNLAKSICDYWNNKEEVKMISNLIEKFSISRNTAINYLKKGAKLGWCNYDAKEEMRKCGTKNGKSLGRKISIFKDDIVLETFYSSGELERQSEKMFGTKLLQCAISSVCSGKLKQYKGYTFKYVD